MYLLAPFPINMQAIIKGIEALEQAHATSTIVLDKTGTITAGSPRVSHIELRDGDVEELVCLASSLEAESTHPIASAVHTAWENMGYGRPPVDDVRTFPGLGLVGSLEGEAVAVGNLELMEKLLTTLPEDLEQAVAQRARRGVTVVLVAKGQRLLGWLEISDRIRETSAAAVKRLKQAGIDVVGDLRHRLVGAAVIEHSHRLAITDTACRCVRFADHNKLLALALDLVVHVGIAGVQEAMAFRCNDVERVFLCQLRIAFR